MKKKPELLKRSGKSSLTLRNFLNNLKENDLHYENKQITQCVFLGVLRLKPVPSIFNKNNVPSVSAPVENNKPKRIKNNNSNREQNKNVSRKNDINKVIGGKVSKKNPEKVKAAVKKVPDKKNTCKIKLHTNKKTSKLKKNVQASPNDGQKALTDSPESSQATADDPVRSTPAIGLKPLSTPTKFNPVQSLFDKLKQKIDSSNSEPGPSTLPKQTNKAVDSSGPSGEHSKVCKINAKRPINPSVNGNRKSKKTVQRGFERLSMPLKPTSPITISDSDSTGKKDDVIIVDENNVLNSQEVVEDVNVERGVTDDIIFVNDDPKPVRHKERTSPRNKTNPIQDKEAITDNFEKHGVVIVNDEQKSAKAKHRSPPKSSESTRGVAETRQKDRHTDNDVIVISEEPKTKKIAKSTTDKIHSVTVDIDNHCKAQEGSKNDVIVIDEMRECRVSPRTKNVAAPQEKPKEVQSSNTIVHDKQVAVVEVIVIGEETNKISTKTLDKMENFPEKSVRDKSKTQELNITIDDQNVKNMDKTSPRLLKTVHNVDKNTSVTVKNELIESNEAEVIVINEKPKQRKPKLKSPLIPPMFLNAPMLLRSELAPKKTTPEVVREKPKRKERSKLLRSDMEHTKNLKNSPMELNEKNSLTIGSEDSNILRPRGKYSRLLTPDLSNKKKSEKSVHLLNVPQTSSSEEVIFVSEHTKKPSEKYLSRMSKLGRPEKSTEKVRQTDVVSEVEKLTSDSLRSSDLVDITPEPSRSNVQESQMEDAIIILNEKPVEEQIHRKNKSTSTRLLRSELAQQKSPETSLQKSKESNEHVSKPRQKSLKNISGALEEDITIKEEVVLTEKSSPRLLRSDLTKQKIPENSPTDVIEVPIKNKEALQKKSPQQTVSPQEDNSDNIINIVDISDPQENLSNRSLGSDNHLDIQCEEKSFVEVDREVTIVEEKPKSKKVSPRTLRSDGILIKVENPEPNKTEEVVLINDDTSDDKCPPQKENPSSRLLRSEIAQQKTRTKSPQKNKQIDLDEIVVVKEKRVRKPKERTISGRLLRSELAMQKSRELLQVKTEVEEVIVLIHDEPKPKRNASPNRETLQKTINIQEEVIVLAEKPQSVEKLSPRSLRSDTSQKCSPEKISPKTKSPLTDDTREGANAEKRRLLRSEQNVHNLPNEEPKSPLEAKVEKQRTLRSENTPIISPQSVSKDHLELSQAAEEQVPKQTLSSRTHKSVVPQRSPENIPIKESKSPSIPTEKQKLSNSEIISKRSPHIDDQPVCVAVQEKNEMEPPTSPSRSLRSQQNPQKLLEESACLVEKQKSLISEISQKTSIDQCGNSDVVEVQMESIPSSRLLRSVASRGLLEQTDSEVKTPVRKRSPRSDIAPSKIANHVSKDVDRNVSCDANQDIGTSTEPYSPRSLRSDVASIESSENQSAAAQTTEKIPPKIECDIVEIIDDMDIGKQDSPRSLRSEMSLQSPTISSKEQSESTEAAQKIDAPTKKGTAEIKVKKRRFRKTKTLLIKSIGKLKTPMLLRSELAQQKNPSADASKQRQGLKIQKRRFKPKVVPTSNIVAPVSPNIQTGKQVKSTTPKRKTLIGDLKRKNSPKQEAIVMQNLKSNPGVIAKPAEELSANQRVNNKNCKETVADILPSSMEIESKVNNSTDTELNCNSDAPKVVNRKRKVMETPPENLPAYAQETSKSVTSEMNIERDAGKQLTKGLVKRMTKVSKTLKGVMSKADDEKTSEDTPLDKVTEHPVISNSTTLDTPKSVLSEKNIEKGPVKKTAKRLVKHKTKVKKAPKSVISKIDVEKSSAETPLTNGTEHPVIANSMALDASKSVTLEMNSEKDLEKKTTKRLVKRKTNVKKALKSVISKIDVEKSSEEGPRTNVTKNPVISDSMALDAPKSVTLEMHTEEDPGKKTTKCLVKRKTKVQKALKSVISKIDVKKSSEKDPRANVTEKLVISNSAVVKAPKSVTLEMNTEKEPGEKTKRFVKRKAKAHRALKNAISKIDVEESSEEAPRTNATNHSVISNNTALGAPKSVTLEMNTEKDPGEKTTKRLGKRKTKVEKALEAVILQNNIEKTSGETPLENITEQRVISNSTALDTPESVTLEMNVGKSPGKEPKKRSVKRMTLVQDIMKDVISKMHFEETCEEVSQAENPVIPNSTALDAVKSVTLKMNVEKELGKEPTKRLGKRKTTVQDTVKHAIEEVISKMQVENSPEEVPDESVTEHPETSDSTALDVSKSDTSEMNVEKHSGKEPTKRLVKNKTKVQDTVKDVIEYVISTKRLGKNETKVQDTVKDVIEYVISKMRVENTSEDITENDPGEKATKRLVKRKTKVEKALEAVIFKNNAERTSAVAPQENLTEHPVICNSTVLDAPKSVTLETNIETDPGKELSKCSVKSKTSGRDTVKDVIEDVISKMLIEQNSKEAERENVASTKNSKKRKSNSQISLKSTKPKLSIGVNTPTKLNDVDLQASGKITLTAKRKYKVTKAVEAEASIPNGNMPEQIKINTPPKIIDTTVYDFDETEPEVVPLRLTSPRRNRKATPENSKESRLAKSNTDVTTKPKKRRLTVNKPNKDDLQTKAQAKAKLIAMFNDKSPQKDVLNSPDEPKGKSTKTKCASNTTTDKEQSVPDPIQAENTKKKSSVPDKATTSPVKTTSPMKQTTITDMFNKVFVKNEKTMLTESVFGSSPRETPPEEATDENTISDMAPPKVEKKFLVLTKDEEEENGIYDDDSDCDSRVEWMPEEYAEYKFKYCAQKMMNQYARPLLFKCKICLLRLPSYYLMAKHKKVHDKEVTPNPYSCLQCEETFPTIEELTAHLRIHKGKLPYACNKCDIGFATKTLLDEHSAIHVLKKIKQPNKRFRCEVCGREFRKLCDIERHTRVHTGEKPCVCNICNKGFQQSHNLSKHLLTHLHLKPFHCEICNKQFGRNDVLSRHLLTHSLDKPVKCPFCSKAFIRQTQLNNHIKNHPHASRVNSTTETQVDIETEGDMMTETEFVAVESKVDPLETKVEPMTETKAEPN